MSQPSDPTWVAPENATSAPSADAGVTAAAGSAEPGRPDGIEPGSGWLAPTPGGYGTGGGPPGGYGPAGSFGGPVGSGPSLFEGQAPILVSFAPPAKQNRLTILFRGLLAIPHLIILWALTIAVEVVVLIGWFGALFTGSLPQWAHAFVTGVLRWQARVYAYLLFLTGSYPPFSLEDEPYPVRLVTARARLNRFAVFFRLILVIPAGIVGALAGYGLAVASFFCWLIALVAGGLPVSLHQALAAILRFQARYYGYFGMVSGDYPWWGLFGDPVASPVAASGPAADDGVRQTRAADPWKLPLSGAAKALVSGILVLGLAALVVAGVVTGSAAGSPGSALSNARSLVLVTAAYSQLSSESTTFESAVQACSQLSCVTAQDQKEATALRVFASSVSSAGVTGSAAAAAGALVTDANGAAQSLDTLAASITVTEYQSVVSGSPLQHQLNSLDTDYRQLADDLRA